jgi:hypothetical protein
MIDRLLNIDRRIVFLVIFIAVAGSMLVDIPMPIKPSPNVKNIYDYIEKLKDRPDAKILLSFDYGPGSAPELQPTAINIIRQCFRNDIKVVGMCLWPDAQGLAEVAFDSISRESGLPLARQALDTMSTVYRANLNDAVMEEISRDHALAQANAQLSDMSIETARIPAVRDSLAGDLYALLTLDDLTRLWKGLGKKRLEDTVLDSLVNRFRKQQGTDYVFLGYKPGATTLVLNMGENFKSAFARDYVGRSTDEMEVTKRIAKLEDFDYVVTLAAGQTMDLVWVAYAVDRYNVTLGGACTAVMAPDMFPYLHSGQMNGLVAGLAGAAEYETLMGAPGSAVNGMRSQVAAHLVIILFIIFGNVMYFIERRRQRAREV